MSYASLQDLIERYGERDLRMMTDPQAQQFDSGRANQALNDASAEIDTWLASRYVLPLVVASVLLIPTALVRAACDIAVYRLQTLRPSDDIKDARARYEDVIKLLKSIASGEVTLGATLRADVASGTGNNVSAGLPQFVASPSDFARGNR